MKIFSMLLLVVSFVISTFAKAATPSFTIAIIPENSEVMAGFPLRVKTLLTNTSNHPISVSHEIGGLDPAYSYEVRDSGGRLLGQKEVERPAQGSAAVIMLKPGEGSAGLTELSAGFDLTRPGVYSIQMERPVSDDPKAGVVRSNVINVTVTERLPFMLRIDGFADGKPGGEDFAAKAGKNVGVNIEKRNLSKQEIDCSTAVNNFTELDDKFHYEIRDSNGEIVPPRTIPQPDYPYTRGANRTTPCKTGESAWSGNVNLTKVYDLTQAGKYTVQIWQYVSNNPRDGVVKSNKVALTVTP